MNGWSSFANDKKIADKWRQFLTEAPIAGINSDVYPDSLTNMLQPMVDQGIITIEEKEELISLMLQLTTDDDIVLEALGGPSRDPRSFSDASTRALNDLISSLGLKPDMRKRLDGVFDQWARLNTVKFSQTDPGIGLDTIELPPPAIPEPGVKMPLPPIIGPPIDDDEEEEITSITTTGTGDDEEEEPGPSPALHWPSPPKDILARGEKLGLEWDDYKDVPEDTPLTRPRRKYARQVRKLEKARKKFWPLSEKEEKNNRVIQETYNRWQTIAGTNKRVL